MKLFLKFLIIPLIGLLTVQCSISQNYISEYTSVSIAALTPNDSIDFSTWMSIDTFNVQSNRHIVIVDDVTCISNERYSYFTIHNRKSNIGSKTNNAKDERILIDHKKKRMYVEGEKKEYPIVSHTVVDSSIKNEKYTNLLEHGGQKARITFDSSLPPAISNRLVSNARREGVREIWSSRIKMTLRSYGSYHKFDFKALQKILEEECILQERVIDLIFP